jgi:signal transduction histidine kinase
MSDQRMKDSISFRFLAFILGLLIVIATVVSTVFVISERETLKGTLASKGQGLASYIAKLSQDPLIMKDYVQLDSIVNEANKDQDILYALIRDPQGKTFTSQYASVNYRSPRVKRLLSSLPKNGELAEIVAAIRKNEAVLTVSVPITAGTDVLGEVTMGMSEYAINQQITRTVTWMVFLTLGAVVMFGVVLFIAFKRIISDPITELAKATTRLAGGDLSAKVAARGGGEIRTLMDSFNRMAEDLQARTSELLDVQEELVRKEKLAILGQLSGSVGHELRNPLGVMSNAVYFLNLVLSDADETTKEYLGIIKHEIDNSLRIISDLLDFARTKPPQRQSVTAEELVRQSLERCSIPDNVTVTVDIPEALPRLHVDPPQMGQVLMNFITNGVQAMPDGGTLDIAVRLVASVEGGQPGSSAGQDRGGAPLQEDAGSVAISVADSGGGIAAENRKKLFQPLFTTKAKGIGLGLVVCKNLVEAHGGRIGVESEQGRGTTFTVTLQAETT